MKTNNSKKQLIISVIFFILSFLSFMYFKNGTDYKSTIDKYLFFNVNFITILATVVCIVLTVVFLVLSVICFINIKNNRKNKLISIAVIVSIIVYVILIISSSVIIINTQINEEKTITTIPDTVSYVDFDELFEEKTDGYYEQTTLKKVTSIIPVNYSVEQFDDNYTVKTDCIEITDNKLLNKYYEELLIKYCDNNYVEFKNSELNELHANKGIYYNSDKTSLTLIVLKDSKVYILYIDGLSEINDKVFQQVSML